MPKMISELMSTMGYYLLPRYILIFGGRIRHEGDELILAYNRKRLIFKYLPWAAYPLNEVFVKEIYGRLNVKGKVVVDVGASIGDTAIYFSLRGAKHVYGFEVNSQRWELGRENLRKNSIRNATIYLSPFKPSMVKQKASVLKVDCEGCEYLLFNRLGAGLRNFDQIIVEYHAGSAELSKRLASLGFEIEFLTPKNRQLGVMLATKGKRS